jgi:hypothetical protein
MCRARKRDPRTRMIARWEDLVGGQFAQRRRPITYSANFTRDVSALGNSDRGAIRYYYVCAHLHWHASADH